MEGTSLSDAQLTTAAPALPAGAVELERRAAVVERLREAERDVARAAAVRLERVQELRVEAEAVAASGSRAGADGGGESPSDAAHTEHARDRVRFSVSRDVQRRSVRAEVAAALRISERTAETVLELANALSTELVSTMEALRCGDISERHARLIWEHWTQVRSEDRPVFEAQALLAARRLSAARLVGRLREIQERLHPETATVRHQQAVERREVWVDPCADGTAILSIRHSVERILAAQQMIEQHARGIAADPGESRTLTQVRADTAIEFLMNAQLGTASITPTVHLTVPALSVAGISEDLAIIDGYGPIDLETARELLAEAPLWVRVVTHPVTGTVLATDQYRPTRELRDWLRIRDQHCRAPGCGRRAVYCELDHTRERARDRGPTAFDNLAFLCVNHHKLKTLTGWSYRHLDQRGTLEWTTPLGETYITEPAVRTRGEPLFAAAVERITLEHEHVPEDWESDPHWDPGADPNPDTQWWFDPELRLDLERLDTERLDPDRYLDADLVEERYEIPADLRREIEDAFDTELAAQRPAAQRPAAQRPAAQRPAAQRLTERAAG